MPVHLSNVAEKPCNLTVSMNVLRSAKSLHEKEDILQEWLHNRLRVRVLNSRHYCGVCLDQSALKVIDEFNCIWIVLNSLSLKAHLTRASQDDQRLVQVALAEALSCKECHITERLEGNQL